ncbi:MAG TPA: CRISPR-associated helicase Cas3' [Deltaproteobacteria bacterium]|nr:CRISPR-associated helicase Cas3' [Deltaproteobacteria bacterium]
MTYYARENQELLNHLTSTANLAKSFASVLDCGYTAYITGMLHDLGKHTDAFQDYLKRSLAGEDVTRGEVIHALQGARYVTENINDVVIADIIGNVIASHHGGLFDNITNGERTIFVKINKDEDLLHYAEAIHEFSPKIDQAKLREEILNFYHKSQKRKLNLPFMLHLLTKMIYSCVVDADRCNSAGLEISEVIPDWGNLIQQLEKYLAGFSEINDIDKIRKSMSEQCQRAGCRQQGIYTLSVPTGGGKTLSSLRFALEHAKAHKLKRIIYVIPYLSILDQTAEKLHEVFADENGELILEHHSNMEPLDEDDKEEEYRMLTSRWDSPIILTTMVQFLETIYSNKASKLRKFHNMSEAVLIFDEIQALPIKCTHLFNGAVNFLQTFGKSTILLCTATQPHLHKTERPVLLSDKSDIVSITPKELKIFERVHIEDQTQSAMDHKQIAELVKTQIEQGKSTLVILNTKGDARGVYEQCKPILCEKAFLTTDLCPAHRLDILDRLRENLDPKTKRVTLCVSTQLIEAGVDVSFDCVIRAEAGLDSIIQAAGRCNRNKENLTPQSVFVVDVENEKLLRLPEIKEGKSITARVFREKQGANLLSDEVINLFYKYFFYDQKMKMDYNTKNSLTTIYSLLSNNPLGIVAYRNRNNENYTGLPSAFRTAAEEFSVIDGVQTGIVVPYGDALQLIEEFHEKHYSPKDKMKILKQLQKYTVSVYSHDLEKLDRVERAVSKIDDTFYLLSKDYYDADEQGLQREAMLSD